MQAGPQTAGAGAPDRCRSVVGTTGPGAVAGSTAAGDRPLSRIGEGIRRRVEPPALLSAGRPPRRLPAASSVRSSYVRMRWRPWPTRWGPASAYAPSPAPITSLASAWHPSAASRRIAWARRDPEDREDDATSGHHSRGRSGPERSSPRRAAVTARPAQEARADPMRLPHRRCPIRPRPASAAPSLPACPPPPRHRMSRRPRASRAGRPGQPQSEPDRLPQRDPAGQDADRPGCRGPHTLPAPSFRSPSADEDRNSKVPRSARTCAISPNPASNRRNRRNRRDRRNRRNRTIFQP